MKKSLLSVAMVLSAYSVSIAQQGCGPVGFVNINDMGQFGITGGGAGEIVHVTNRADFEKYVSGTTPYVIILDNDLEGLGLQDMNDVISVGSNKTIIGAGAGKTLNGICIDLKNQQNVIFRNITLTKGREDGMSFRTCHHIWIDHCDLSDSYDGLLDFTIASDYMTCSWTKLSNHNKVSITNSGTCHYEDYGKEHVTFAHDWFASNTQRNPRIGYGRMHIYNCYWTDISSYCIGYHSQAQVLSEYNYFTSSANKPFMAQYTHALPYAGSLSDNGSYSESGKYYYCQPHGECTEHEKYEISYTPKTFYNYDFDQIAVKDVPAATNFIGPKDGLQYEPILSPGNGAIDVPVDKQLFVCATDGAKSTKVYLGTSETDMKETDISNVTLTSETTYYWKAVVTTDNGEYSSPVYRFTTASDKAVKPSPEDGETNPWLRYPSSQDQFCTSMPLSWKNAFDANIYKVYIATSEEGLDAGYVGETTALTLTPSTDLKLGQKYYWRVDAVKKDGTTVKGNVWSFSSTAANLTAGTNEAENMYKSGIAFDEDGRTEFASGKGTCGDQGPGSLIGIWNGAAGKYAIETTVLAETTGKSLFGISVNGKLVDTWMSSVPTANAAEVRKSRNTVALNPGDEIRVEFVAGYVDGGLNEGRARIDAISFTSTDQDIIEVTRPSGIYHAPELTAGLDYEDLKINDVVFTDSLGTVGEKGSVQVKDGYCSWITKDTDKYTLYLKGTAMVKIEYLGSGNKVETVTKTLNSGEEVTLDVNNVYNASTLSAIRIYKNIPVETSFHAPSATTGYDYEMILSPDVIFLDSEGKIGVAGKYQMREGYDTWMTYYNPTATEVQSSNRWPYINPVTDAADAKSVITGTIDGNQQSYVVGTVKSMTYYLTRCEKFKVYYTGSGGTATNLAVTITDVATNQSTTDANTAAAAGKNAASATAEYTLDPWKSYTIEVKGTTGDMCIYATKLWPISADGISNVNTTADNIETASYSITGQKVSDSHKGVIVKKGKKLIRK